MRKRKTRDLFRLLLTGCFMLLSQPLLAGVAGSVEYVRGAVTAQHATQGVRILGKGADVFEEDVISTANRSFVIVKMKDGTRMTVRPNSSLGIEKYIARNSSSDSAVLNLFKGGLRAITGFISKKRKDAYKIRTSVATIGIRGTEFDARLCEKDCQQDAKNAKTKKVAETAFVIGRVAFVRGQLSATDRHKHTRQLFVGGPLYEGDRLKTGLSSFAVLAFRDRSRVTLNAGSDFHIKKHHFEEEKPGLGSSLMVLFKGGIRAVSGLIGKKNRQNYSMRTPVATIGIRGTGYDLQCEGDCVDDTPLKQGAIDQLLNFIMKPANAIGGDGMYAHVWSGEIELSNKAGSRILKLNETAFINNINSAPKIVPNLPLFMRRSPAPRPDKIELKENLFSQAQQETPSQGLYVTVYDGHVSVAGNQGPAVDLGRGEAAFAGIQPQKAIAPVRLRRMPSFQVNDAYPRPESFSENWETLFNEATNPDENQDMECIAR